jgi:hypothetical protein
MHGFEQEPRPWTVPYLKVGEYTRTIGLDHMQNHVQNNRSGPHAEPRAELLQTGVVLLYSRLQCRTLQSKVAK